MMLGIFQLHKQIMVVRYQLQYCVTEVFQKESCIEKDKQIKKLESKLEDVVEQSEVNIAEMKKIHKQSKDELQNRLDDLKKTCQK